MGTTYGRQDLSPTIGYDIQLAATLDDVEWKAGGLTIDWDTVTAVAGTDVTLTNGSVVKVGQKALLWGQVLCKITASGAFGPYDSTSAADGRDTLTPGECYIVNQLVLESGPLPGLLTGPTNHVPGLEGGLVWFDRLLIGAATNPLGGPNGPSLVNFYAAFPSVRVVKN